jgi:hypothetical protein
MSSISKIVESGADADDVLRSVVAALVDGGYRWAGIFFVEGGRLALGPQGGEPDPASRNAVPVVWQGEEIAELVADGSGEPLEPVAALIAPYCLVGWDTGGEPWNP